ncbi:MAG TPA: pantetheine-phosphate adenylyltransferase [Terriglobales bacterium]|jgi:pantetheine-phosphate adenylyltransferase|nr:pantetheine-phosphate adenylyltransferase [Terriglobales bacterium]
MQRLLAIYPGSFDPPTLGHLDVIERGHRIFPRLLVAVLRNADKQAMFTAAERVEMLREATRHLEGVEVCDFQGLLVDFARERGAGVLVRGIRAISDYEYEFQMAWMNRRMAPDLETVFLMPGADFAYLSSRLVKEVAAGGRSVAGMVSPAVEARLQAKLTAKAGEL